jgi:hypothetical protein
MVDVDERQGDAGTAQHEDQREQRIDAVGPQAHHPRRPTARR